MQQDTASSAKKKETTQSLRRERRQWIDRASKRVKRQRRELKAIRAQLAADAATVPEIAKATGMQTADVMWYLAALKKYGEIVEATKDGSYFRYTLSPDAKS